MILQNKYALIGIGVFCAIVLLSATSIVLGVNFTGFFKAFDKTLSPGEYYEKNITVRKFYNVSVRFQKEGSTGYLSFDDEDATILLRDASGKEIANHMGVNNGRVYLTMTNYELASVASVSAYNISDYADVVDQEVNDSYLSFSGASAYITVKVHYGPAAISGYVIDDLTGEAVGGVTVAAFEDGADPATSTTIEQNVSASNGKYMMTFDLTSSKALDMYVKDYDVV